MKAKKDYKSEILDIIKTKDWDRAKKSNDEYLYNYIYRHRNTDEDCKIIWKHIGRQRRDYESEVLEIIRTKDWSKARPCNDNDLYAYISRHKNKDKNCKIIWEHIRPRDFKSEILEIVETKDWDRARYSNDKRLYNYIKNHKDEDKNCRIVSEHMIERHSSYTIKDYLLYYFKYGKPKRNSSLCQWFNREIKKNNQCCIDVKNLIIAAETYQDQAALETLELIKNHLEKEDT